MKSIYVGTELLQKFNEQETLSAFDLDDTLGTQKPDRAELFSRGKVIEVLQKTRTSFVFSSARAPEHMMSSGAFGASKQQYGFDRGRPLCGKADASGAFTYAPLESLTDFTGHLDPDAIIGFGTGIYVRDGIGYRKDPSFLHEYGEFWRLNTLRDIKVLSNQGDLISALALLEDPTAYARGLIDVEPLSHRIQFEFHGKDAEKRMIDAKQRIKEAYDFLFAHRPRIKVVDESKPELGRFTFYLMPEKATKKDGLDHLVRELCRASGKAERNVSLFIAGDSLTDLPCVDAASEANAVFVLPSGSRLSNHLCGKSNSRLFAGEDLGWIMERLSPTDTPGCFTYKALPSGRERKLIVCDEHYPGAGTSQSVLRHLIHWLHNR